ncbi:hypothetical protein [Pseudomonas fluorescens]|uniref:hypothetical protein n=1 Tax=Pseudomonas fluorescens TaxID=294 RepID=UPI0020C4A0CC|nr:hypothetical protein [Pseudomonas fluorescens]UTL92337.1 hypothetical protein NLL86_06215 [Pseudomonas fluorescens]
MPDFVFNYASVLPKFDNVENVIPALGEMLKAMAALEADFAERPAFRLRDNPWAIEVAETADSRLSLGEAAELLFRLNRVDEGTYFVGLAQMSPSWDQLGENVIESITRLDNILEDPALPGTHALAVEAEEEGLVCAVTGSVLTSLFRRQLHSYSEVGFVCDGQAYGFDHVSNEVTGTSISQRLKNDAFSQLSQRNFSELKGELFPNLLFGEEIDELVGSFPNKFLNLLFSRLKDLESISRRWSQNGVMPENCIAFQSESDFTMNKYGYQRNRKGYDGVYRIFELHIWVGSGTRIHLFKHAELKKIEIGYVGPHLDTKMF